MLDVALAPAGFQRRLGDQGAGIHAQFLGRTLRVLPDAGDEAFRGVLAQLRDGGTGRHCIGRADGRAAVAGGGRPLVAVGSPVLALQAADVRIFGTQRAVHAAAFAPGDQVQRLFHRCNRRVCAGLGAGGHLLQQMHGLAAVFQRQRRCRLGRCIELIGTAGLGRVHAGIQRRAIGGLAGQLPADHAGQAQAFAAGHRLGNLLVVHLAEHLVFAGEQRVAEAGVTHALDQHLRELAFQLARDLVDLRRIVLLCRVQIECGIDAHIRSPRARHSMRRPASGLPGSR